jgi:hypothetical protein
MKGLWQKVVPMVRCWKILVLLRLDEGFEAACSLPEKIVWCPEAIKWQTSRQVDDVLGAGTVGYPANLRVGVDVPVALGSDAQFEPP